MTGSEKRPLTNSRYRSASYAFFRIDGMLKNTIHRISPCNDVNMHRTPPPPTPYPKKVLLPTKALVANDQQYDHFCVLS